MAHAVQLHSSQKSLQNTVMLGKYWHTNRKKNIPFYRVKKGIINPSLTEMRARGNSHKLLQVTFQLAVQKPHNDRVAVHRDCWISIRFRSQPEKQPDLTFKLALLWEGGWTRWPLEVHSNTKSSVILSTPDKLKKKSLASISSYSKKAKWNLIQLKKKKIRKFKIKNQIFRNCISSLP